MRQTKQRRTCAPFSFCRRREGDKVAPSMYHRWQEQVFQNARLALEGKRTDRYAEQQKIEKLEHKIRQKDEALAELMVEHIALKKELGEL